MSTRQLRTMASTKVPLIRPFSYTCTPVSRANATSELMATLRTPRFEPRASCFDARLHVTLAFVLAEASRQLTSRADQVFASTMCCTTLLVLGCLSHDVGV